jgi:hypothetical protein
MKAFAVKNAAAAAGIAATFLRTVAVPAAVAGRRHTEHWKQVKN